MNDLKELRERLAKAQPHDHALDNAIGEALGGAIGKTSGGENVYPAYTTSIDAALGLVIRLLPEWRWSVSWAYSPLVYQAILWGPEPDTSHSARGNANAPLAILAALLDVLIEEPPRSSKD